MKDGELLARLRARGWRVTPQRRAVVTVLEGGARHASADEVHTAARSIVPEISLATVYNVLTDLVEMGEVSEVRLDRGAALFDANVALHYHHICNDCGRIADVPAADVSACMRSPGPATEPPHAPCGSPLKCCLGLPELTTHGYAVESVEIVFHGHCGCVGRN
jgi:Fe2+ or Zn2+ uptake regulation protein